MMHHRNQHVLNQLLKLKYQQRRLLKRLQLKILRYIAMFLHLTIAMVTNSYIYVYIKSLSLPFLFYINLFTIALSDIKLFIVNINYIYVFKIKGLFNMTPNH